MALTPTDLAAATNLPTTVTAGQTGELIDSQRAYLALRAILDRWPNLNEATVQRLSADATTTATTVADVASLMFSVVAGGTYTIDWYGVVASSINTAYPRFAYGGTATATSLLGHVEVATSTTGSTTGIVTVVNTLHTGANIGTAATNFKALGHALIVVNATGTFGLRWAASAASTQTLRSGSYAILNRIG